MGFDYGYCAFIFILLYLGHYIGDYILQRSDEAVEKITNNKVRFWHSWYYATATIVPWLALIVFTESRLDDPAQFILIYLSAMAVLLATHYVIDDRKLVGWIIRNLNKNPRPQDAPLFIIVEIDQTLHKIVLLFVAVILTTYA